jgi:hypothetical protein
MSTSLSFYLVTLLNAGSIFGRLGAGAFGVAAGQFNVLFATCLISTILIWAWLSVDSNATTMVFAVFYGAFSGGKSPTLLGSLQSFPESGFVFRIVGFIGSGGRNLAMKILKLTCLIP